MMRNIVFTLCALGTFSQALLAQSEAITVSRDTLLQRFVAPKPMSYRAVVIFGPSNPVNAIANQTRLLEVQNGQLTSSPAVPGAQFAVSDQSKAIATLLSNYQVHWDDIDDDTGPTEQTNLAERSTRQLKLIPRDGWRYTRVLWLDEQTGVPLKTEIYRKNELIERIQVKSIDFFDLNAQVQPGSNDAPKADAVAEISKHSVFYVRNVPTGFALTTVFNDTQHVQQIYSDGLARVSVFVQSLGALPAAGYSQRGSTSFVVRRNGNVDLVAVGDVPQATLDRFLSGVDAVQQ